MGQEIKWQKLWQGVWKTNKLLEWIQAISEATSKSSDEILEALNISKKQFATMPGIQESKKMLLDLNYIHYLCEKLRNDLQMYRKDLSEDQMRSRNEVIKFIPEYTQIREYFHNSIEGIENDRERYSKISHITNHFIMITMTFLHFIEPSQVRSIMHLMWYIWTFEEEYKKICDDTRYKILVK